MKDVRRYDNMGCPEEICRVDTMYESNDGDYVLYEDYEALQAECEKLRTLLTQASEFVSEPDRGEPVATLLIGEPEHTKQGWESGDWDIEPNATTIDAFAKLAKPGAYQLYLAPQSTEQKSELAKYQPCGCVICTCEHETQCQGCGGHHCGTHPVGQFTAPAYLRPAPDVSALVEALEASNHRLHEQVDGEDDCRCSQCRFVRMRDAALAAWRQSNEEK